VLLLIVLAFTCGALAVALQREHARAECLQDAADLGLTPDKCGRQPASNLTSDPPPIPRENRTL
jgi:hypothetical protein